jgi:hypothetical protein
MPRYGQSSAVRRYVSLPSGFDRPLPMLGAICRCPNPLKCASLASKLRASGECRLTQMSMSSG